MIALLDVNMLVALMDPKHVHHGRARAWWSREQDMGWASCPVTENGFLRIVTLKAYPSAVSLADAIALLRQALAHPRHAFWPDDFSLFDAAAIDHSRLLGPRQITDVYLLALAVKHGGRLVTLDTGIARSAALGAAAAQLVVV